MPDHAEITWFHSIDLGNEIITKGTKSHEALSAEFDRLQLSSETLRGKKVLDIGCNDGFMSVTCAQLGADVTSIDVVCTDGLKFVRNHSGINFRFYAIDLMSQAFFDLGRFDIILYFGVLYHSVYPYEQLLRLKTVCNDNATLFLETAFYNLPGCQTMPTLVYNYDGSITSDLTSPCFPSIPWIEQTLGRIGFSEVTMLQPPRLVPDRGRATFASKYDARSKHNPLLYGGKQRV